MYIHIISEPRRAGRLSLPASAHARSDLSLTCFVCLFVLLFALFVYVHIFRLIAFVQPLPHYLAPPLSRLRGLASLLLHVSCCWFVLFICVCMVSYFIFARELEALFLSLPASATKTFPGGDYARDDQLLEQQIGVCRAVLASGLQGKPRVATRSRRFATAGSATITAMTATTPATNDWRNGEREVSSGSIHKGSLAAQHSNIDNNNKTQ